jgi:hypothetical protein
LENSNWFASVGILDGIIESENIVMLTSWSEAIFQCSSIEWENLCLEAQNQFRMRVLERNKDRYLKWNDTVDVVKPHVTALVKRKIEATMRNYKLDKIFEDTVFWDILGVCMESEFTDVYPPGFFASQAYWYVNGHFPCGWVGEFPNGKLIIY